MMTLSAGQQDGPMQEVASLAKRENTLITEPGTLEALTQAKRDKPVVGLLGSALLQGGRGVISEASVGNVVSTTSSGFEAAQAVSKQPTQEAAVLLNDILDHRQSERLTRILRFFWEGHGGAASDFPVASDVAAQLTGTDLRYLLDGIDSNDEALWRRMGRSLSLDLLTRIPPNDLPDAFQKLVTANAGSLSAKAVRVAKTEVRLGDPDDVFEWFLSGGNLALRGSNFTAYIAATSVESLPTVPLLDGPSISTLRERAQSQSLNVGVVRRTIGTPLSHTSRFPKSNLSSDEDLVNVSGALGLATRVAEATVILDGRRLICDFEESTAKGHTNATFPVSDLVRVAIPLMQSVDESTREKLVDLGTQPIVGPDGGEQLVIDFAGE